MILNSKLNQYQQAVRCNDLPRFKSLFMSDLQSIKNQIQEIKENSSDLLTSTVIKHILPLSSIISKVFSNNNQEIIDFLSDKSYFKYFYLFSPIPNAELTLINLPNINIDRKAIIEFIFENDNLDTFKKIEKSLENTTELTYFLKDCFSCIKPYHNNISQYLFLKYDLKSVFTKKDEYESFSYDLLMRALETKDNENDENTKIDFIISNKFYDSNQINKPIVLKMLLQTNRTEILKNLISESIITESQEKIDYLKRHKFTCRQSLDILILFEKIKLNEKLQNNLSDSPETNRNKI